MKMGNLSVAFCFFLFCIITPIICSSQVTIKFFTPGMYSQDEYNVLRQHVGKNKRIPPAYEKQVLIALSYFPELIDIEIEFRFKHTNTSFSTRPSIASVLKRSSQRKYIITISDSSKEKLVPLQLKNLDFNAQIGVLG